jgi:hypothetical protein
MEFSFFREYESRTKTMEEEVKTFDIHDVRRDYIVKSYFIFVIVRKDVNDSLPTVETHRTPWPESGANYIDRAAAACGRR